MIKYRTSAPYMPARIDPVEVERETETFVYIQDDPKSKPRRVSKDGDCLYRDTWEEAHEAMRNRAQRYADAARRNLDARMGTLGNIKGLKKPEETA